MRSVILLPILKIYSFVQKYLLSDFNVSDMCWAPENSEQDV